MKAFEFLSRVEDNQTLKIPSEIASRLQGDQALRVLLLVQEDEEADWSKLTAQQFFQGYTESDAIYDQLSAG